MHGEVGQLAAKPVEAGRKLDHACATTHRLQMEELIALDQALAVSLVPCSLVSVSSNLYKQKQVLNKT